MARPRHPELFTPAEQRVLEALRAGKSNPDIALELGISLNTVKYHVGNMLAKTGTADRQELANYSPPARPASTGQGRRIAWGIAGLATAAAAAVAVLLVAFLPGDDQPPQASAAPGFADALRYVPGDALPPVYGSFDERRTVAMFRVARARELAPPGVDLAADQREILAQLPPGAASVLELTGQPGLAPAGPGIWGALSDEFMNQAANWTAYGIDPGQFELLVDVAVTGPWQGASLAFGDWDADAIDGSLDSCSGCSIAPTRTPYEEDTILSWTDPLTVDPLRSGMPPFFDRLGRASALTITGTVLYRSLDDAAFRVVLDTAHGRARSLAGEPDFVTIAGEFDAIGAVSAFLTDAMTPENMPDYIPTTPLLQPYTIGGAASGRDAAGPYLLVALAHDSETAATANAVLLPGRIATLHEFVPPLASSTIERVEARGRFVFALLRSETLAVAHFTFAGPGAFEAFFLADWQ